MAETSINWEEKYLGQIEEGISDLRSRFAQLDGKLSTLGDKLDTGLSSMDDKIDGVNNRLDGMDGKINGVTNSLDGMDKEINGINNGFDCIYRRIDGANEKMTGLASRGELHQVKITVDRFYWFFIGILGTTLGSLAILIFNLVKAGR